MAVFNEVIQRDHKSVAQRTEVCCILDLFCEDVTRVDLSWNVADTRTSRDLRLTHSGFAQVQVLDAFRGNSSRPIDTTLIVVVDVRGVCGFREAHVGGLMFDAFKMHGAFVGGNDLGLARAKRRLLLADAFPSNRPTASTDQKAREAAELVKLQRHTVRNGVAKLPTPASVAVRGQSVAVTWARRSRVGVCLEVMMMWEVVEGLQLRISIGVKRYAVVGCRVEVSRSFDCRFVMLHVGSLVVRRQERQQRRYVRTCACRQPVNAAREALVDLLAPWEIRVVRGRRRD